MLLDDLTGALKEAMKARDAVRVDALRMVLSAAKEKRIEMKRDLEDEDVVGVLSSQVKRRRESIEQFREGNRADLVEKETREIEVLQAFLPEALSEEALAKAVEEAIAETGATSKREMGKVMKVIMARFKGQVDGKAVNRLVASKLA
jgi:uncharacterized protein YqeY